MLSLDVLLKKVDRLPTLPAVAAKILSIAGNPDGSARELGRIVSSDPALASRVLKLVNSPLFGVRRHITSVPQAILLLGFDQIRALCLAVSVFQNFDRSLREVNYSRDSFWNHCSAVGYLARLMAQRTNLADPDTMLTVGLLHDIGMLVQDQFMHEDFVRALALAQERQLCFDEAESASGLLDHAGIGGLLLEHWNYPQQVWQAVKLHHRPLTATTARPQTVVVAAADWLCDHAGIGFPNDRTRPDPGEDLWKELGLNPEQREECLTLTLEATQEQH